MLENKLAVSAAVLCMTIHRTAPNGSLADTLSALARAT